MVMSKTIKLFMCLALMAGSSCTEESITPECDTLATVRDLSGLDGCGFVFELEDGTRLEPIRMAYCGTMPLPPEITDNPLYNFEFAPGKKVKINYTVSTGVSTACMTGTPIKVTCLTELSAGETDR
jgi:hypothetical protein